MNKRATLTSRERVLYALEHKPTDQLPVMLWIEPHTQLKIAQHIQPVKGLLPRFGFQLVERLSTSFPNPDIRAAAPLIFHAYQAPYLVQLGSDALDIIPFHPWKGAGKVFFEQGKLRIRDIYGITRGVCGIYLEVIEPACQTKKELQAYTFPDFSAPSFYDNIRLHRRLYPNHALCVWCPGVQDWTQGFYGLENLYYGVVDHPRVIKKFFRKLYLHSLQIIKGSLEAGADILMIGDDYGTQESLWMSEEQWRDLTYPFLKKQIEAIHSYGGKALLHSCGHVEPLVKYFVQAELDGLHPLQPTANRWKKVIRRFGKQLCFFTGIDTQSMLTRKPKEVREDLLSAATFAAQYNGLVLTCTHFLQHNTPIQNMRAMFRTLDKIRKLSSKNSSFTR